MLQCRITGNNDEQKFVRTYYSHTVINTQEFRGAATPEHLATAFPSPDTHVRIQMGDFGVMFDPENAINFELSVQKENETERFTSPVTLMAGRTATMQIGELKFNVEIKDMSDEETGSDVDEGFTIFKNSVMVVTRHANGIQVTSLQDSNCSIHISASNQFYERLNVTPSDGTDVRLTNGKERPVVQFLPDKHL